MFTTPLSLHYTGSSNQTETNNDVTTAVTHVKLVLDSLTPDLAKEISRAFHDLCFTKDGQIHDQLSKVTVRLREPQHAVTAKMALDSTPHVVLRHVRMPTVVITKRGEDKGEDTARKSKKVAPTAETLRATLNCLMLPESNDVRAFLCQMAGKTFFFAFEPEEKQLDFGPDPDEDDDDQEDDDQPALEFSGPRLAKSLAGRDRKISDGEIRAALKEHAIELLPAHFKALTPQHREEILDWTRVCREIKAEKGEACTFDDLPLPMSYLTSPAELGIAPVPDPAAGDILDDQRAAKGPTAPRAKRRSTGEFKNTPRVVKAKPGKKAKKGVH